MVAAFLVGGSSDRLMWTYAVVSESLCRHVSRSHWSPVADGEGFRGVTTSLVAYDKNLILQAARLFSRTSYPDS